jgi:hypothetical protein
MILEIVDEGLEGIGPNSTCCGFTWIASGF